MSDFPASPPPAAVPEPVQSPERPWKRRVLIGLGIVAVLAFLFFLLWPGTTWWVEHVDGVDLDAKDLEAGKDRQDLLDKARSRFTALATGILATIAIIYTASNARSARRTAEAAIRSSEASHRAAEASERTTQAAFEGAKASQETAQAAIRTAAATERGLTTSRFTAAVEQLGNTSPAIQLGGVYALAGIADDEPAMRQTCIDVLCAYLRLPHDLDPGEDADPQDRKAFRSQREVRHTSLRLISSHLRLPALLVWPRLRLHRHRLRRCRLPCCAVHLRPLLLPWCPFLRRRGRL